MSKAGNRLFVALPPQEAQTGGDKEMKFTYTLGAISNCSGVMGNRSKHHAKKGKTEGTQYIESKSKSVKTYFFSSFTESMQKYTGTSDHETTTKDKDASKPTVKSECVLGLCWTHSLKGSCL